MLKVLRFIAANVRSLRRRRELTQEQLSELAGVDLRFLQKIESGKANLSVEILVRLSEALSVRPGLLLRAAHLPAPRRGRPRRAGRATGS